MNDYSLVLIAVLCAAIIMLFIALFKLQRLNKSLQDEVEKLGQKVTTVEHDVSSLCVSGLGVDERVAELERRVRSLIERLEELEGSDSFEHLQEFQGAIELAKKGASVDEIVEKFHLTVDEAGLLIRLHTA